MGPELSVTKKFLREELTKCRAHGQREGYNLKALERGDAGNPGTIRPNCPRSSKNFNHHLQLLVRQGPFSHAKRSRQLRAVGPSFTHPSSEQRGRLMRSARPKSARSIWVTHLVTCRAPLASHVPFCRPLLDFADTFLCAFFRFLCKRPPAAAAAAPAAAVAAPATPPPKAGAGRRQSRSGQDAKPRSRKRAHPPDEVAGGSNQILRNAPPP